MPVSWCSRNTTIYSKIGGWGFPAALLFRTVFVKQGRRCDFGKWHILVKTFRWFGEKNDTFFNYFHCFLQKIMVLYGYSSKKNHFDRAPTANGRILVPTANGRIRAPTSNARVREPIANGRTLVPTVNRRTLVPTGNSRILAPTANGRIRVPTATESTRSTLIKKQIHNHCIELKTKPLKKRRFRLPKIGLRGGLNFPLKRGKNP